MSADFRATVRSWGEEWEARFDERAGIYEFDGGLERERAEQCAYRDVGRERNEHLKPVLKLI